MPFPQYSFPDEDRDGTPDDPGAGSKVPGHGAARVQVNFWFFLFFFYGFYNVTALMWITKVFNLYSFNWYVYPPLYSDSTPKEKPACLLQFTPGGPRLSASPSQSPSSPSSP